jgi:UDP-N-acetylmuramate--alanine ligase
MKHIHFIGIGGTGLSAIARVLLEKGFSISGSDREASSLFNAISAAGAVTFVGHAAEHIEGADLVIRSSAIPNDNPEILAAHKKGIPVIKRADFLQELTAEKETVAIAGSHGKTTTTAMLVWIFDQLGLDPSYIVGGIVNQLGTNAHAGLGSAFIIEADEYDNMFLGLSPKMAVITNIEYDHPDFFPTEESYLSAFVNFLARVQPGGIAFYCLDDLITRSLLTNSALTNLHFLSYGISSDANYRAAQVEIRKGFPKFTLQYRKVKDQIEDLGSLSLKISGHHNILNAIAALAVVHQWGLPINEAMQVLSQFTGVNRRFEVLDTVKGITIIDDYGHHPSQLNTTLKAARARYPGCRLWAVWQPHTYSRTMALEEAYIQSLNLADKVLVLKIYSAREENPGYSAEVIAQALPQEKARYFSSFDSAIQHLLKYLKAEDVLIIFSAGDATYISQAIGKSLKQGSEAAK